MKKTIAITSILLGMFLFAGIASASDVETLQPASTITYNEDLTVNGTGRFDSVYIGEEGVGGVTFFNGTIVNIGETVPVTFGDDVRIDGEIYRTQKGGDPLKISDNVIPTANLLNDLGSSSNRWKKIYAKDGDFSGTLNVKDIIWSSAKTYSMSINGLSCTGQFVTPNAGYCTAAGNQIFEFYAFWNIDLPNNSKIKSLQVKAYDKNTADLNCSIMKNTISGTSDATNPAAIDKVTTQGTPGWTTVKKDNINETVENDKYSYYIHCDDLGTTSNNDYLIAGFKIEYSKNSPD